MADPHEILQRYTRQHALPPAFTKLAARHYLPFAETLVRAARASQTPVVIGINGAQGTGKSTLAALLADLLRTAHGLRTAVLSIDDLYLTRAERTHLASTVHPLLITRGVPGTHEVALGCSVLDDLAAPGPTALPRFDKATDDRLPASAWPQVEGPVDLVLFEGWCTGASPEPEDRLIDPVNTLEAEEDPDGTWRSYVNHQLAEVYPVLFNRLDYLAMLQAPSFACIRQWRGEQEDQLRAAVQARDGAGDALMDEAALDRFLMHYQRLTQWMLEELPARADTVWQLNPAHGIESSSGV